MARRSGHPAAAGVQQGEPAEPLLRGVWQEAAGLGAVVHGIYTVVIQSGIAMGKRPLLLAGLRNTALIYARTHMHRAVVYLHISTRTPEACPSISTHCIIFAARAHAGPDLMLRQRLTLFQAHTAHSSCCYAAALKIKPTLDCFPLGAARTAYLCSQRTAAQTILRQR